MENTRKEVAHDMRHTKLVHVRGNSKQTIHALTSDHLAGSDNVGLGLEGIMKMARIGCTLCKGGLPSTISMQVIASDQISACPSYGTWSAKKTGEWQE